MPFYSFDKTLPGPPDWMAKHSRANRLVAVWFAQPSWVDRGEIRRIYQQAKRRGMQVDHIVPIVHPLVCGLHVHENLQELTLTENMEKSNTWWPDMPPIQRNVQLELFDELRQLCLVYEPCNRG